RCEQTIPCRGAITTVQGGISGVKSRYIPELLCPSVVGDRADASRIGKAAVLRVGDIPDITHVDGRAVGQRHDAAHLPTSGDLVYGSGIALAEWQLIYYRGDKPPSYVEVRQPTIGCEIVPVQRRAIGQKRGAKSA